METEGQLYSYMRMFNCAEGWCPYPLSCSSGNCSSKWNSPYLEMSRANNTEQKVHQILRGEFSMLGAKASALCRERSWCEYVLRSLSRCFMTLLWKCLSHLLGFVPIVDICCFCLPSPFFWELHSIFLWENTSPYRGISFNVFKETSVRGKKLTFLSCVFASISS